MFCIVPHGGRQMFLLVDQIRLRASTSISRPESLRSHVLSLLECLKTQRQKGRPRGRLHSDAQVNLRARKHQNSLRKL